MYCALTHPYTVIHSFFKSMTIGPCPIIIHNPPAFIQAPSTEDNTAKYTRIFAVVAASPVTYFLSKEE